jgi:ABC-type arginine/histidine transport system permease subunit
LFRIGQDAAATNGNLSPLLLAGLFYLIITVPLTHLVNYFDKRLREGRPTDEGRSAELEVEELAHADHR